MAAGKRVLITGASGMLGRAVLSEFTKNGWDCLGLAFSRTRGDLVKVDLCNADEVTRIVNTFKPSVLVHAAAERRPDAVEKQPEATRSLNVTASKHLADLCSELKCFLIYISTDYVFDGSSPPYKPSDTPNPINAYGQSKLDGERAVTTCQHSAILRVPILYGEVENLDESAVTVLFKPLKSGTVTNVSNGQRRYPTHTKNVASVCCKISEKALCEPDVCKGIWHYSGNECFTKYTMVQTMGEVFSLSTDHLNPVSDPVGGTPRPHDCQLDFSETDRVFGCPQSLFKEGIAEVLQPF